MRGVWWGRALAGRGDCALLETGLMSVVLSRLAPERRRENGAWCFYSLSGAGSFHPQFAEANDDAQDGRYIPVKLR